MLLSRYMITNYVFTLSLDQPNYISVNISYDVYDSSASINQLEQETVLYQYLGPLIIRCGHYSRMVTVKGVVFNQ